MATLSHAVETLLRGGRRLNRVRLALVALGVSLIVSAAVLTTPSLASAPRSPSKPSAEAAPAALQPRAYLPICSVASHITPVGPNCRYGVSALSQPQMDWLPDLGAGWYLNFAPNSYNGLSTVRFIPTLTVHQDKNGCQYLNTYSIYPALNDNQLGSVIAAHPGALWVVGNEPDRGPNPPDPADPQCTQGRQGDTYPDVYAQAYHDAYVFIKQRDPTAQIANAGLVEITPGRLQYLDLVEQAYRRYYDTAMPVDVWNMHLYILPEANPLGQPNAIAQVAVGTDASLAMRESGGDKNQCGQPGIYCFADHDNMTAFADQIVKMRTWMKAHGEQNKPFIITEYSQLYPYEIDPGGTCFVQDENGQCFTQSRVTTFLNKSFSYLNTDSDPGIGLPMDHNRLVQQWLWFSLNLRVGAGTVSNLLTDDLSALTQPGRAYRDVVAAQIPSVNLFLDPLPATVAGSIWPVTGTGTARLVATVRNNGNTATTVPFTVTFYADQARLWPIGSVQIPARLDGCTTSKVTVRVDWTGLTVGKHSYWVYADSGQSIAETDETDNITSGTAEIFAHRIVLPVLRK